MAVSKVSPWVQRLKCLPMQTLYYICRSIACLSIPQHFCWISMNTVTQCSCNSVGLRVLTYHHIDLASFWSQGRIRGTYGINAKPLEPSPPQHASDPLPLPGVTRASLRPKPIAKVNQDDEPSEVPSQRHHRVHASAAADVPQEQPSSPLATRASAPGEGKGCCSEPSV